MSQKAAAAAAPPPLQYWADEYLPFRQPMRKVFDNIKTEFFVTALVLINMALLLVDMMVTDESAKCGMHGNSTAIRECTDLFAVEPFQVQWTNAFQFIELAFLSLFTVEILLRLYAYGHTYFFDVLNSVDAIIVIGLLIVQIFVLVTVSTSAGFSFLRIIRLIRLVRLFVVMNKVQKASRAYKKAKYLKLGSPVERVMELLGEMKQRTEDESDLADISWIMHLISSDKRERRKHAREHRLPHSGGWAPIPLLSLSLSLSFSGHSRCLASLA
jgi:hypothetical protein